MEKNLKRDRFAPKKTREEQIARRKCHEQAGGRAPLKQHCEERGNICIDLGMRVDAVT